MKIKARVFLSRDFGYGFFLFFVFVFFGAINAILVLVHNVPTNDDIPTCNLSIGRDIERDRACY